MSAPGRVTRMVRIEEQRTEQQLAEMAAAAFAETPDMTSFGDIEPGGFVALRWGCTSAP